MEHSPHLPSAMINYTIIHTIQRNTPTETRAGEPATWAGPPRVEVAHGVVAAALPARAARVRAARRPVLAVAAPVLRTRVTSHADSVMSHVASVMNVLRVTCWVRLRVRVQVPPTQAHCPHSRDGGRGSGSKIVKYKGVNNFR